MRPSYSTLTKEQSNVLYSAPSWGHMQQRDQNILLFLLHTGLKVNEFINLNVSDVYTGNAIRKSLVVRMLGKKQRRVPIAKAARQAALAILEFNRAMGGSLQGDEPFIISRQRNKKDGSARMTPRQVQRIIKALHGDANATFRITPQTLRHTYARAALEQGADIKKLQRLLGHRSIKTTRDLYGEETAEENDQEPAQDVGSLAD